MSHSIYYRSMFVKLNDNKFIPLIEVGSSNCYDVTWNGRYRRERDWQQMRIEGRHNEFAFTREEIMQEIERRIKDEKKYNVGKPNHFREGVFTEKDIESMFGYFSGMCIEGRQTRTTTAQQIRNFFMRGFEQSVDMVTEAPQIKMTWSTGDWEHRQYHQHTANNEKELTEKWNELTAAGIEVWLQYEFAEWLWENHRHKSVKKAPQEYTTGYVVNFGSNFVTKLTSRRLFYNSYMNYAKIYTTRAAAQKVAERIKSNYDSITDEPTIIEVHKDEMNQWHIAA